MPTAIVADDDPQIREVVRNVLQDGGFHVIEVGNGMKALGALQSHAADLIVLDIFMPELGGLAFLENLPARYRNIPVIAMTGGADMQPGDLLDRAKRLGAARVFSKPFKVDALAEAVRELVPPPRT
jgi:CheY-like chemotaxis protein